MLRCFVCAILHDDRINELSALHATLTAVARQTHTPPGDHESATAWATIRSVDSRPQTLVLTDRNPFVLCHS